MPAERGLTVGRFLPLHQGHALLLRAAAAHCAELVVLIGTTASDPYSYAQRERWITELLQPQVLESGVRLLIYPDPDLIPSFAAVAKDQEGTITDQRYWRRWLKQNAAHLNGVERVYTSDPYGAELSRRLGARWFPVDPGRKAVPISGSQIRAEPRRYFEFVCDVAKPEVGLTVAVLGAESTGKSTLVQTLARHYGTRFAPEWGRTISEAHPILSYDDFTDIVTMQRRLIAGAQCAGSGLCFTDTEAITTALFAPLYLQREHDHAWAEARDQAFDLYLVLAPSVPWVDDGTRILDDSSRQRFHDATIAALERLQKPYQVIDAGTFPERLAAARQAIDRLLRDTGWSSTPT